MCSKAGRDLNFCKTWRSGSDRDGFCSAAGRRLARCPDDRRLLPYGPDPAPPDYVSPYTGAGFMPPGGLPQYGPDPAPPDYVSPDMQPNGLLGFMPHGGLPQYGPDPAPPNGLLGFIPHGGLPQYGPGPAPPNGLLGFIPHGGLPQYGPDPVPPNGLLGFIPHGGLPQYGPDPAPLGYAPPPAWLSSGWESIGAQPGGVVASLTPPPPPDYISPVPPNYITGYMPPGGLPQYGPVNVPARRPAMDLDEMIRVSETSPPSGAFNVVSQYPGAGYVPPQFPRPTRSTPGTLYGGGHQWGDSAEYQIGTNGSAFNYNN